jgi:ubiquinone/menaquinone biosynthesis C-methylase UbiE
VSKQAANFVGSIPENYDRFLGPRIFHDFADDVARRVSDLRPRKVLELAAGTGIVTRKLRDLLPDDCAITATDLNPPMLNIARSKFQNGERVYFESADATQLPYDTSDFDAVVCQFGVMFFPNKQRSYEEVFRTLKPGGHYVFTVWGALNKNPFAEIAHQTVVEFFPDDPPGFYQVPFGYSDANAIEKSVTDAGFSNVSFETLDITSEIPSSIEFATGLVFGNPLFEEITSRGGEPDRVRSAISDALERQLGGTMPLQALVIVAKKPNNSSDVTV